MLFNENQFGLISQLPLAVLSYQELEIKNLELKNLRQQGHSQQFFKDKILSDLAHEKLIKAVMVCFSDLEGCFKSLDYDKQFFIKNSSYILFLCVTYSSKKRMLNVKKKREKKRQIA